MEATFAETSGRLWAMNGWTFGIVYELRLTSSSVEMTPALSSRDSMWLSGGRDIALFPTEWGKSGSRRVPTWNRRFSRIADVERMRVSWWQRLPWEFNYTYGTMAPALVMKGPSPGGHQITWYLQYISRMVDEEDSWRHFFLAAQFAPSPMRHRI